jgi:hypothetical protein
MEKVTKEEIQNVIDEWKRLAKLNNDNHHWAVGAVFSQCARDLSKVLKQPDLPED